MTQFHEKYIYNSSRINSKRLPRKVLEKINGKPMITHVVEKCLEINDPSKVIVLSDSNEVLDIFKNSPIAFLLVNVIAEPIEFVQ